MHNVILAAAMMAGGDSAALVEACKAALAAPESEFECAAYLRGFGDALNTASGGTYQNEQVRVCFQDGVPVPLEAVAQQVVRLGTPEITAEAPAAALAMAAYHFAAPCK